MKTWPQTAEAWRIEIERALSLSEDQARAAFTEGRFAHERLEVWIQDTFGEGFHPDFVPALLRNQRGLIAWAYGAGAEPYWPGSDNDGPTGSGDD